MTSPANVFWSKVLSAALFFLTALSLAAPNAQAANPIATDPTVEGQWTPAFGDYQFPAKVDDLVTKGAKVNGKDIKTEIWARVWYPTGREITTVPIVIALHGNHGVCGQLDPSKVWYLDNNADYALTGECPKNYRVTPNHWGYDYIGKRMASQGYLFVSINVNRGINAMPEDAADPDISLIMRRGRMILRHLQLLGQWNIKATPSPDFLKPLLGKLDFTRVSLTGHSRGGDAIVSAYYQFRANVDGWRTNLLPRKMNIVALAAIAPTDNQTQKRLAKEIPLQGVAYGVLLPMCDGDVDRLNGVKFYDRAVGYYPDLPGNFRATFAPWSADHNHFNTEWHNQDGYHLFDMNPPQVGVHKCPEQGNKLFPELGRSDQQQAIGLHFVTAVIRSRAKAAKYGELLNPAYDLPPALSALTRFDRGFLPGTQYGANALLLGMTAPKKEDCAAKIYAYPGATVACGIPPEHNKVAGDLANKENAWIARVLWGTPAVTEPPVGGNYFVRFLLNGGAPVDITKRKTLELRLAPDCQLNDNGSACKGFSPQDAQKKGSQGVYLIFGDKNGKFSNYVPTTNYTAERRAVGLQAEPRQKDNPEKVLYHSILSSVRIPFMAFRDHPDVGFDPTQVVSMFAYLSPSGPTGPYARGGLFFGDIWATDVDATVVASTDGAEGQARLPRPPASAPDQGLDRIGEPLLPTTDLPVAAAEVGGIADPGVSLVEVKAAVVPAASRPYDAPTAESARETADVVTFTFATPQRMAEPEQGFFLVLGGRTIPARFTGLSTTGRILTSLTVPAAEVRGAPDGASVSVGAEGRTWRFGSIGANPIR